MGTEHSASVFYGTWVPAKSPIGRRLNDMVNAYGGTPAPVEIAGVALDVFGDAPCGNEQIAIVDRASELYYSPRLTTPEPRAVTGGDGGRVHAALRLLGIPLNDVPPIGWYFAARAG